MDEEERARHFWERTLREIHDDGFFAPVQTADPPTPESPPVRTRSTPRITSLHLVLMVVAVAVIVAAVVLYWVAPALV
jgi:hypothetical protein